MENDHISIAIVDDHTLFRRGISALMGEFKELHVVFEAGNGEQMQQMLGKNPLPQVILMDITMPLMNGYESTCWLKENYPNIKVLALSMFEDDKAVVKMIRCGACGYVLKESSPIELLDAIKIIFTKGFYFNELVSGNLVRSIKDEENLPRLSQREAEFLSLCCSELTYKEIADRMFISPRTVDNYRDSLFEKLSLKSRTGLVLYAVQNEIFKF